MSLFFIHPFTLHYLETNEMKFLNAGEKAGGMQARLQAFGGQVTPH